MELAILSGENADLTDTNLPNASCLPQSIAEIPAWESLALSTYSYHEPDHFLKTAFQAWYAQTRMKRLILKPYRRILRRWNRLTEESKRGEVAWTFYRQALMRKAFNSFLYRVTTCTHLTVRLGFKTLRDIANIRRSERDVAAEYYCARLCARTLRNLFQAITTRCQIFLQIQRARELRLLSYTFRYMRVEASHISLALRIYRRMTLYKVVVVWRQLLRIRIITQRINLVSLRKCFVRWRQRFRRGLALSRSIYIRQGYDEELAFILAASPEDVRLLLRAFYSWLKRTRYELHQRAMRSVLDAFQKQYLLRSALHNMVSRYRTIVVRRQAISLCLQSITRQTLIFALRKWKINAQNAKLARISCNIIAREHEFLIREQAFCAWREAWSMHCVAKARYGPLASTMNKIIVRYTFQELYLIHIERRYYLEQAIAFKEERDKQWIHKAFSIWYTRLLQRENTVQLITSIVRRMEDKAYDICRVHESYPGQWFLDTSSYKLLQKAWDAVWWKYMKRSAYRATLLQADKDYNSRLLARAFITWIDELRIYMLLVIQRPRIVSNAFTAWRLSAKRKQRINLLESQAEMKHDYSLFSKTFYNWRHIYKVVSIEYQLEQIIYQLRIHNIISLSFNAWHAAYLQDTYLRVKEKEVTSLWSRRSLAIALRSVCAAYLSRLRLRANRKMNIFTETLDEITANLSSICTRRLISDIRAEHMKMLTFVSPTRRSQESYKFTTSVRCDQVRSVPGSSEHLCWEMLRGHRDKYRSIYREYGPDSTLPVPQNQYSKCEAQQLICILDSKIAALSHRLEKYSS